MSENINLKEIKRQVYLFYSEDGLVDLAIGLMIFGFGIFLMVDLPALVGLLGLFPFLVWYFGKRIPGFSRGLDPSSLRQEMKKRFVGFFINMCLIGLGVFVLYLLNRNSGESFLSQHPLMLFGFVLGLAISSLGMSHENIPVSTFMGCLSLLPWLLVSSWAVRSLQWIPS